MKIPALPETAPAVVFSLSTLIDGQDTRVTQDVALARSLGLTLSEKDVARHMGKPAHEFYPAVFGREFTWEQLRDKFLELGDAYPRRFYPGALATLDAFRDAEIPVGIVTLCSATTVGDEILRHNDMRLGYFAEKVGRRMWFDEHIEGDVDAGLPYNALLIRALGEPVLEGAVVVGDEKGWFQAASALEAPAIGIPSSLATHEDLANWDLPHTASSLSAARDMLLGQRPTA